jgi:hypothetical protein
MTGAERVAKRRAALRAQGLRPKTFWLPDTTTPEFQAGIARAVAAINAQWEADPELEGWIDAMADDALSDLPPPEGLV